MVGRVVTPRIQIAWDGSTFVDETANLVTARGSYKLMAPGSAIMSPRGIVNEMSVTLWNRPDAVTGRRYSPLNTAGPLYTYIAGGGAWQRPITFDVKIDSGSFVRVFTGTIKIPKELPPTYKEAARIQIDARTVDEKLLNLKINTSQTSFVENFTNGVTESDLIKQWLAHYQVAWPFSEYQIDNGMFTIMWGWLDDESVIDEIWALAAACGGRFYASPEGKLIYENMSHWLLNSTSTETITVGGGAGNLSPKWPDESNLFNEVTVEASPRMPDDEQVLWEPEVEEQVPAGGVLNITARLKYPAYTITGIAYQAVTVGGTNISGSITCTHTDYAQRIELHFENADYLYAATLYKLQVMGRPVVGAPLLEEKRLSTAPFWNGRLKRSRSVRSNVYVQTRAHAAALAEFLRDTQETPSLTYMVTGLQGLPGRQLGSRITIDSPEIMTDPRDAYITGITWNFSNNGFTQDLEAVDAAGVFKHTLAEYFVIDTDLLDGVKIVFY